MSASSIVTALHDDGFMDGFAASWPNHTPREAYEAALDHRRRSPRLIDADPTTLTIRMRDRMSDGTEYTTTIQFVDDDSSGGAA